MKNFYELAGIFSAGEHKLELSKTFVQLKAVCKLVDGNTNLNS